jgi:hypothetical protein
MNREVDEKRLFALETKFLRSAGHTLSDHKSNEGILELKIQSTIMFVQNCCILNQDIKRTENNSIPRQIRAYKPSERFRKSNEDKA